MVVLPDGRTATEMVLVPDGEFIMGASSEERRPILEFGWSPEWLVHIKVVLESAGPPHVVYLDIYYIDKYEVTNGQYEAFTDSTGTPRPVLWNHPFFNNPEQPVMTVSWQEANDFCSWAGKRLPTEAEWEKAARGPRGHTYPWGDTWDSSKLRSADGLADMDIETFAAWARWKTGPTPVVGAAKVGSYLEGRSPYGAWDMAGNVWEWVADWHGTEYYDSSPERNPQGPSTGQFRVLRGGGWDVPKVATFTWYRETFMVPEERRAVTGFRCALTPES